MHYVSHNDCDKNDLHYCCMCARAGLFCFCNGRGLAWHVLMPGGLQGSAAVDQSAAALAEWLVMRRYGKQGLS